MTSFGAATAVILFTLLRRNKQLGKNFAVFIVGADLCVCPGVTSYTRPGQTHRSAPTMDNAGLFLRECLRGSFVRQCISRHLSSTEN
jgi:hypothetical protein